jgi:regulatory protein
MPGAAKAKKELSREEILEKLRYYCAYQERSRLQVERKMRLLGCEEKDFSQYLELLSLENFLNEERFVRQFIRSRASAKGWGPRKIKAALLRETGHDGDHPYIEDEATQQAALKKLEVSLRKKMAVLTQKSDARWKEKSLSFCLSRGFDYETSMKLINQIAVF